MQDKLKQHFKKNAFYYLLLACSIYYFIFLGEPGYVHSNDSAGYLKIGFHRLPVYPLLFQLFLTCFGPDSYQLYMTYFQGLLATAAVMTLLLYLSKQFALKKWQSLLIYAALIMPYGIDTLWNPPRYVYTHYIATEGLTYSLYYFFIVCLLQFLLQKKASALGLCLIIIPLLCNIRSQLMICYPTLALSIVYVYWHLWKRILLYALCTFLSFASVSTMNNAYHWYFQGDFEDSAVNKYTLFANLLFVADAEDVALIEDPVAAGLFEEIYEQCYALEYHYDFAPNGLIGLADKLIDSHDKIKYDFVYPTLRSYTSTLQLETQWQEDRVQRDLLDTMISPLRQDNLAKWLHTCTVLIPEALMLSLNPVTPPQVLWLCYLYAIVLTLAIAAYLIGYLLKYKRFSPQVLSLSAVFLLLLTNAAGLSFSIYGLSRYTNYNLGLIYSMLFLCLLSYQKKSES